jgi:hypothetical protein
MYALSHITINEIAPRGRSVVVRALSGNGMAFDLPRGG